MFTTNFVMSVTMHDTQSSDMRRMR